MWQRHILYVFAVLIMVAKVWGGMRIPDEQRLYEKLMYDYQKSVRPVKNASNILVVKFALRLNQIMGLDERQQVLESNVFIDQEWRDENFVWNPEDYGGIHSLRVAGSNVWLPDTFVFNNADDGSTGFMSGTFVQVRHDGSVLWPVPVKLKSSCKVDITYFPFDDQRCILKFGSWIYSGLWLDYVTMFNDTPIDMNYYVNNSEWDLLSVTLKKNVVYYDCCNEPHPDLTFVFHIRRRTFYYIFNIIVPCIMLSLLTLLTFWMPPTSGEKVTLGLNVFLAFSMFMLLVAEQVPATSEAVPLIGIYLCVVMTMTSVSVIMAVIVINVYNRGMKMKRAPAWLRTLTLNWMSAVLRIKHDIALVARHVVLEDYFYEVTKRPDHAGEIRKSYSKFDLSKSSHSPIFMRHSNAAGYQPMTAILRNRQNNGSYPADQWRLDQDGNNSKWLSQEEGDQANGRVETDPPYSPVSPSDGEISPSSNNGHAPIQIHHSNGSQASGPIRFQNQNIACPTQTIVYQSSNTCQTQIVFSPTTTCPQSQAVRYEEAAEPDVDSDSFRRNLPHHKKTIVAEWQSIAIVVDRFLFWFYCFVTFTAYLIVLIVIPAQHYTEGKRGLFSELDLNITLD